MYDYLDRPIDILGEGDRFLLWSMRGWTQSMAERRCPPSVLAAGFARSDLAAMLPHFHLAMMALNRDGLDKLGFGMIGCATISEAEAILLATTALYATDRAREANATVALLVRPEGYAILRRASSATARLTYARFPFDASGCADSASSAGRINGIGRGVDEE